MWEKKTHNIDGENISYAYHPGIGDTTMVIVPGGLSTTKDYTTAFSGFRLPVLIIESCIVDNSKDISFKGQVIRIHKLFNAAGIKHCILIGHSMGAPIAIMAAIQNKTVKALGIVDYVPVYPKLGEIWLSRALLNNSLFEEAITRFVRQCERVDTSSEFAQLSIPVYLLKPELSAYVSDLAIRKMTALNPALKVMTLRNCDHDLNGDHIDLKKSLKLIIDQLI